MQNIFLSAMLHALHCSAQGPSQSFTDIEGQPASVFETCARSLSKLGLDKHVKSMRRGRSYRAGVWHSNALRAALDAPRGRGHRAAGGPHVCSGLPLLLHCKCARQLLRYMHPQR